MVSLLTEPDRPRLAREHRLAPWFAVVTVCFGAFMGQLDASIVTVAFPAIQRSFGAGLAAVQWVSLAYLLALVALLVPVGRRSDAAGRKLIYLYGFLLFTAASAACGLAWSLPALVGLRVAQAIGAAMLQANSVALVVTSVPPGKVRTGLGVQAAAQALGLALGPTLGGVLVGSAGWRWVFWINVPVGAAAIVAAWLLSPRTRQRARRGGHDPVGGLLLATASTTALLGLSGLSGLPLPTAATAGLLAVALVAVGALVRWEHRAPAPLLDLALLSRSGVAVALSGALGAYLVLFGSLVLIPQALGAVAGGAARIGALLTALPAGFAIAALGAERIRSSRWANRRRCLLGGLLAAAAAAALATAFGLRWVAPDAGWIGSTATVVPLGLIGLGLGLFIPANNTGIMNAVPAGTRATAGGMINMARGVGTALGVATVSLTLHLVGTRHGLGPALSMAALAGCALLVAATGRAGVERVPR